MRGAVLTGYKQPLEILDLPDPIPGPTDVVIRTEACGVCRSDWHLWQHDWTWLGIELQLPRVPGHEFGGTIVEAGREVKAFRAGDRVTVPFHLGCGHCDLCRAGRYNLCLAYGCIGIHHDGGYGGLVRVPNADATLVRLPDSVDSFTAAALGCRFMTSYHAVVDQAAVRPGEWVAVFGVGGVGLSAVQIAAAMGARVIAVGRSESKLALARREGAELTVRNGPDTPAQIVELTKGGAAVTVDALGSASTTLPALKALGKSRPARPGRTDRGRRSRRHADPDGSDRLQRVADRRQPGVSDGQLHRSAIDGGGGKAAASAAGRDRRPCRRCRQAARADDGLPHRGFQRDQQLDRRGSNEGRVVHHSIRDNRG